ncbi:hypothetical protein M0813_23150 [Anaeramoeba flamelloides]|uniref:Uncharacterized protein n=1 Tax=Anaeramoeba flamelloides TaxID=1746091 RepID=A0ABQ8YAR4_9EUKA|nr:hypothetical protein M0813_23150 [Anaeramoeba flamelloides]
MTTIENDKRKKYIFHINKMNSIMKQRVKNFKYDNKPIEKLKIKYEKLKKQFDHQKELEKEKEQEKIKNSSTSTISAFTINELIDEKVTNLNENNTELNPPSYFDLDTNVFSNQKLAEKTKENLEHCFSITEFQNKTLVDKLNDLYWLSIYQYSLLQMVKEENELLKNEIKAMTEKKKKNNKKNEPKEKQIIDLEEEDIIMKIIEFFYQTKAKRILQYVNQSLPIKIYSQELGSEQTFNNVEQIKKAYQRYNSQVRKFRSDKIYPYLMEKYQNTKTGNCDTNYKIKEQLPITPQQYFDKIMDNLNPPIEDTETLLKKVHSVKSSKKYKNIVKEYTFLKNELIIKFSDSQLKKIHDNSVKLHFVGNAIEQFRNSFTKKKTKKKKKINIKKKKQKPNNYYNQDH